MMNWYQAMEIINNYRPERPQSLEKKKLQEAIDTINEYFDGTLEKYKHRCYECSYYSLVESKTKPYSSGKIPYCDVYMDVMHQNLISCNRFAPMAGNDKKEERGTI